MGPSPPPSSSSMPNFPSSAADEWFFNASDRDTQILTQALSICSRGPAPACSSSSSSQFPSPASYSSAAPFYETLSPCLDGNPLQSQSFEALHSLQKQQRLQRQLNCLQQQKVSAMSSMLPRWGDGFPHLEQVSQQKGSPLSNYSSESSPPLSASAEAPASPFSTSTMSQNSAMSTIATESFLAHSKSNISQHHDSKDGRFERESSRSSKGASIALSSQTSVGAGGCKVNKRRGRVSNKTPMAVLSADTSNFRAMVQQLTGIPSSSSLQSLTPGGIPLLKPQPIRLPFTNTLNLPTLDTSAWFLGPKNPEGFSYAQRPHQLSSRSSANLSAHAGVDLSRVEGRNGNNAASLQSHMSQHAAQSVFNDQANGMINQSFSSMLPTTLSRCDSADSLKVRGGLSSLLEGDQISMKQSALAATPATLDSLLMEERSGPKSSMSAVDTWLSFFDSAHANHDSNMEIARMA